MKFLSAAFSIVPLLISVAGSQTAYPPTIRVPVTFYDFHADGSNPDFEPGLYSCGSVVCLTGLIGLHLNEVQSTLDAQRKPVLGSSPHFSQRVGKWFRPWQPGDFTVPIYSIKAATIGDYLHDTTTATDTAYKNVVIPDTLTFNLVPGSAGVYQFNNQAFFVLDGRGFGADDPGGQNPPHNFGFTMELHWEFTYQTGLTFNFGGDDDVWVFINGQMVIDLGGSHGAMNGSVNLDTLTGLTIGQRYMLDLFYAERHVTGSDILITTNLFWPQEPSVFSLAMTPKVDTLFAGDMFIFHAGVLDDTEGVRHEFDSKILWTLTPSGTSSTLTGTTGSVDTFFARQAYTSYIIGVGWTNDSVVPPKVLTVFDTVYVKPQQGDAARFSATKVLDKAKPIREYFTLRGQKLRGFGNSRMDGIVLERIVGPGGTVSVKRKFQGPDSRLPER